MLNITVSGNGNTVKPVTVNDRKQKLPYTFQRGQKGAYTVSIEMMESKKSGKMNIIQPGAGKEWSPVEPDYNMSHGKENANDCNLDCLKLIKM